MSKNIKLYSASDLDDISWPQTKNGTYAKNYLLPLLKHKSSYFVKNVDSKIYILICDDVIFPITVNEKEYDNCYVVSLLGSINYSKEELRNLKIPFINYALSALLDTLAFFLKLTKSNRVVIINNWMLSTNLYPKVDREVYVSIHRYLIQKFPQFNLIYRSITHFINKELQQTLEEETYLSILSRQIYLFDPSKWSDLPSKARWNIKNDRLLIKKNKYNILSHNEIRFNQIPRIVELYNMLYLKKYTYLNPKFTHEMIYEALSKGILTLIAVEKNGSIDAIVGFFIRDGVMTTPLFGYDTTKCQKVGLYRILTSIVIDYSMEQKLILNHSAGAAHFKRKRGMFAALEYLYIYNRHLPFHRRWFLKVISIIYSSLGKFFLEKYKL